MAQYTPRQLMMRAEKLHEQRLTWESHWQEITDLMNPKQNDITNRKSPGQKRNTQILDNTAMLSNELLAGALHGLLVNPNTQWFELTTGFVELDDQDDVRLWLQDSSRRMLNVLNNSNFNTAVHQFFLDLCSICTAPFLVEEDDEQIIRCSTDIISNVVISENNKGIIDEIYRKFKWTAQQLVAEFGSDVLPPGVTRSWQNGSTQKYEVCHGIYPNKIDPNGKDIKRGKEIKLPIISQYVLKGQGGPIELRVGGFNEMPYVVSRWQTSAREIYGRGPGTTALPEAKIVNVMTETIIRAAQKQVDPPLMAPDDGFITTVDTTPGGLNYYRSGSTERIEPVYNRGIELAAGFETLEQHRRRIREAFFVDQLQLAQGPQMTATEVLQRTEEKMRLLGPLLGRQHSEFLRPLIDRVFGIMLRRGLLAEAPEELKGRNIDVQYSSQIARAQKSGEVNNMMKTIELIGPIVSAKPGAMDLLDEDEYVRTVARLQNFPQKIIRDTREIKKLRDARAEAEQELADRERAQAETDNAAKAAQAQAQVNQG